VTVPQVVQLSPAEGAQLYVSGKEISVAFDDNDTLVPAHIAVSWLGAVTRAVGTNLVYNVSGQP